MDVSVIIVSYNTKELIVDSIQSIIRNIRNEVSVEIIVVDNNSTDGTVQYINENLSSLRLFTNKENTGFAKANNVGIRNALSRYVLLLNSDTVVTEDTICKCFGYMESNPDVGTCGCKVVLPDGNLDKACKRSFPTPLNALFNALKLDKVFPNSKIFGAYNLTYLDEDEINDVDCVVGAFMFIRRECLDTVGLLDEDFFMYGEDIDLCYRIKQAGWRIVYYPKTSIIHYKGSSAKKKKWSMIWHFHKSMLIYYDKHLASKYGSLTSMLVRGGIYTRYIFAILINLFRS